MLSKSAEKGEKRFSADDDGGGDGAARTHATATVVYTYTAPHRKSRSPSSREAQSEFNKSDAKFRHEIPVGLIRRTRGPRTWPSAAGQGGQRVLKVGGGGAAAFKPFSPPLKLMGARTIDGEYFFLDAKKRVHFNGKIILLKGKGGEEGDGAAPWTLN